MSSTRKTPVRTRAFTARSTLSVLAAVATAAPSAAPAPLGKAANDKAANDKPASDDTKTVATAKAASLPARAPLSSEERHGLIAKVAYGYAERAGFGSDPVKDWLTAEREIDAMYGIAS
jgi:hypothetical protein